jgi:uncharacterized protein
MPYKHGSFAEMQTTKDFVSSSIGTTPVYIGILPVHQLMNFGDKVNVPILVNSFSDAVQKCGWNDSNWSQFDLCEAVYAHFRNSIQPIGPIILVNVLDPAVKKQTAQTATVVITNGVGEISNDKVILNSCAIASKVLGTDFSVEYSADGSKVIVKAITTLAASVTVTFDVVTPNTIVTSDIVGGTSSTTGAKTGIACVDLVYRMFNLIPNILCSPGWSFNPSVDAALKAVSQKINGHWYAWVNSDLVADSNADTIVKAQAWKVANAYTGAGEAPCWPMAKNATRKFHLSTLATVVMQQVDSSHDGVPYETPSNKPIDITGVCLTSGTDLTYDQVQVNDLNSKGIRTATYWGGRWVLWGPHTGAFEFGKDIDARDKFDSSVRMLYHIMNDFQKRYGTKVDMPMSRSMVDTILNDYQIFLDSLISTGALLYAKIEFTETSNPVSDIVEGDFDFDISTTTTPPGKSITAKVQYTSTGIETLLGGES